MKKLLFLAFAVLIGFSSCEKEEIEEPPAEVVVEEIPLAGDWLLIDGTMYFTNLETNEKTRYSHFDLSQSRSSLRFEGSMYEIEDLIKDTTVWTFKNPNSAGAYGEFILNYDSIQPYGLSVTKNHLAIIEHPTATASNMQLDGSSRPFSAVVDDFEAKIIEVDVEQVYTSINGYNYTYFSKLKFKKIGI